MARIQYDEDDDQPRGPRSVWRRRLLIAGLAVVGLGLGFLVPYTLYLDRQVERQFGAWRWQEPTRVYARPLRLAPGLALDAQTLRHELQAAGYREGDGVRPGTWAGEDGSWRISSHGFRDVDGEVAPAQVELRISSGRVSRLRAPGSPDGLESARLDPARIATLYGARQEERRLVRVEDVPVLLTDALQAVEDRDFARHRGIDLSGMMRAAWVNLRTRSTRQGGSTLTQQLARSGMLGIGREQTWSRKFNEIIYALLLEARYDKGQIMEAYLNQVYVGQRGNQAIRGMAAGAEFWFGRRLDELEPEHVALLVGLVRGPSYYDPRRHPERARERRDFALAQMHSTGLIDADAYRRALAAPLGVSDSPGSVAANRFPAYVDLVRRQLFQDNYAASELQGAGLSVMTAMSPSAQGYAEGAVRRTIEALSNDTRPELQAGLVLTDTRSGEVLAVVGNRDPAQHGFNRAVEARRPVGSLLKPFVYLLALALPDQWSLATPVDDSPVSQVLPNGQRWAPENADGRSHGMVPLVDALARSYNQATVRVGMQLDPRRLAELIDTLAGVDAQPNPSLILGSLDESPYAMAQLYQFLASGGEFQTLRLVRGVIDADGRTVNRYDANVIQAQPGDAVAVRLVTLALQRAVTSGTARRLVDDGLGHLKAAGKTGTSNDGRDSWFAGWTGDHLAVVWMGNDRNEATGLYGATGAMRVWSDMFARLPSAPLEIGDAGLDWRWIAQGHSVDAGCPGARRYAFVSGFAPAWQPCAYELPEGVDGVPAYAGADGQPAARPSRRPARRGWRSWFGLSEREPEPPPAPPPPPAPVAAEPAAGDP